MKRFALVACLLLAACTDPDAARKAAEDMGFTDIEVGDYAWFGCSSRGDVFQTEFKAKRDGRPVEGVVCSGFFSGTSVRLY